MPSMLVVGSARLVLLGMFVVDGIEVVLVSPSRLLLYLLYAVKKKIIQSQKIRCRHEKIVSDDTTTVTMT